MSKNDNFPLMGCHISGYSSRENHKVCYIIGKVTGEPRRRVVDKFKAAQLKLEAAGFAVINPTELVPADTEWPEAMRKCIKAMMDCTHIYCLPCHRRSPGGIMEYFLAHRVEIKEITKKELKALCHAKN